MVVSRSALLAVMLLGCARPAPPSRVANRSLERRNDPAPRLDRSAHARVRQAYSRPARLFGGTIGGFVRDRASGAPLAGVTISVYRSYSTAHAQGTAISEDDGSWQSDRLPDGEWSVTLFFGELTIEVPAQFIERRTQRRVDVDIDVDAAIHQTIVID